ncbi:hypothetical protein [Leclercia sp.]|uniref:hypothetical protein n=1 Tax=Leclercia sp. TaxID=1898428 RepID=UPI0028AD39A4|nr:hypothetical protein [Leclercia sp.]
MRKVECKKISWEINGSIRNKRESTIEGLFHQWGSDFEEFETGPGNVTVAIVEFPDGTVETFPPHNIKFLN